MGKPRMIDVNLLIQAGINPKTLLPFKFENYIDDDDLVDSIKGVVSVIDRQDAVNRYEWYNLPKGITSELIERVIYYKGSAIFFYMAENNRFYFFAIRFRWGHRYIWEIVGSHFTALRCTNCNHW